MGRVAEPCAERVLQRPCYYCGLMFEPTRPHQKHCKPSTCGMAAFKAKRLVPPSGAHLGTSEEYGFAHLRSGALRKGIQRSASFPSR
jgi:hypothetical protein